MENTKVNISIEILRSLTPSSTTQIMKNTIQTQSIRTKIVKLSLVINTKACIEREVGGSWILRFQATCTEIFLKNVKKGGFEVRSREHKPSSMQASRNNARLLTLAGLKSMVLHLFDPAFGENHFGKG